jgi:hypothetical protein
MNYQFAHRNPKIDELINLVCDNTYMTREEAMSKTRKREVVMGRYMIMTILKEFTEASLKTIGEHLGGRDHSTVIHGLETLEDLMFTDKILRVQFQNLKEIVVMALYEKTTADVFGDDEFYSELIYMSNWEGWENKPNVEPVEE